MRILVTGGAGYIGSHVVLLLGKLGHEVVVLDDLSTGRRESVIGAELVVGDIADKELVSKLIAKNKFDAVAHFAGSIIVPESVIDPIKYYSNNTFKTLALIDSCIRNGVENFLFSSTAVVYGVPETGICTEQTRLGPISPYGWSKLMSEQMLQDISKSQKKFKSVILRYFNVAGANIDGLIGQCSPLSTHLIKVASEVVLGKRESIQVFGTDYPTPDGTCIRDYIHIDDLAQAHVDALMYLENGGESEVFNCGYGHGYSVREVLETVKKVSKVDFKITEADRRDGDAPTLVSDSKKIKEKLSWKPKHDNLELIVKTALDWEKKL